MKILVPVKGCAAHPYVRHLSEALEERDVKVVCSTDRFDRPDPAVDVVHVHWPGALCGWARPTTDRVREIGETVKRWKEMATALVVTRHNALPHAYRGRAARDLYDEVYAAADGIVHLGVASHHDLGGAYNCPEAVIPHGWYPGAEPVERRAARADLELGRKSFCILVFGAIRHLEEQRLIFRTYQRLGVAEKVFVVPRWGEATRPSWIRRPLERLRATLLDRRARIVLRAGDTPVDADRIPYLFGASDVVFLPRVDALNSGVLPLAYSYGRTVVGPDIGNLEEILEATNNPIYRAGDPDSAAEALGRARRTALRALGARNRRYAERRWSWEPIARKHQDFYERVLRRTRRTGSS